MVVCVCVCGEALSIKYILHEVNIEKKSLSSVYSVLDLVFLVECNKHGSVSWCSNCASLSIQGTCSSAVTQQFTYMLVKTGTVVLKAQTDMKGYTPSQIIQVTANIHNQSGKSTGNIMASLMQVTATRGSLISC